MKQTSTLPAARSIAALAMVLAGFHAAAANIYKCPQANGQMIYTDKPCAGRTETIDNTNGTPPTAADYRRARAHALEIQLDNLQSEIDQAKERERAVRCDRARRHLDEALQNNNRYNKRGTDIGWNNIVIDHTERVERECR